jgi:hypothetical protein
MAETRILQFAQDHNDVWQSFIVRPGGVFPKSSFSAVWMMSMFLGKDWVIRDDELGAFIAELAIHGGEEDSLILNRKIVERGRELLKD